MVHIPSRQVIPRHGQQNEKNLTHRLNKGVSSKLSENYIDQQTPEESCGGHNCGEVVATTN